MIWNALLLATITPGAFGVLLYTAQRYVRKMAGLIATAIAASSFFLVLSMTNPVFENHSNGQDLLVFVYPWINPMNVNFGFLIDMVSFPIGLVIALVSTLSCLYSIKYMEGEPNQAGYYANMLIFMTGMIGVIFSSNLIQFYLFWELMLIPSYLLVSQWGTTRRRLSVGFKYFIFTHMAPF